MYTAVIWLWLGDKVEKVKKQEGEKEARTAKIQGVAAENVKYTVHGHAANLTETQTVNVKLKDPNKSQRKTVCSHTDWLSYLLDSFEVLQQLRRQTIISPSLFSQIKALCKLGYLNVTILFIQPCNPTGFMCVLILWLLLLLCFYTSLNLQKLYLWPRVGLTFLESKILRGESGV